MGIISDMGQWTVPYPTMKSPINPHHQGARNHLPRAFFAFPRLSLRRSFPPRKICFTMKRISFRSVFLYFLNYLFNSVIIIEKP